MDRALAHLRYADAVREREDIAAQMQAVTDRLTPLLASVPSTLPGIPSILIPVVPVTGTTIQCPILQTLPIFDQAAPPPTNLIQSEVINNPSEIDQEQEEIPEWCKTLDPTIPITLSTTCPLDLYRAKQITD